MGNCKHNVKLNGVYNYPLKKLKGAKMCQIVNVGLINIMFTINPFCCCLQWTLILWVYWIVIVMSAANQTSYPNRCLEEISESNIPIRQTNSKWYRNQTSPSLQSTNENQDPTIVAKYISPYFSLHPMSNTLATAAWSHFLLVPTS